MGKLMDIEDNVDEYEEFIGGNVAENISREYYNGVVSSDENDEAKGAIVWQLCNVDSLENMKSELTFFDAADEDTAEELLDEYKERISDEEIEKTYFELSGLSESVLNVLREYGFKIEEREGRDIYVKLGNITSNKIFMPRKKPKSIISVTELESLRFRQGITNCLFNGVPGLYDDLVFLPKDWYEEDISCAYIEDDMVTGFFLIHQLSDGSLMPVLLFGSGVDSQINILDMLRYSALVASQKYDDSTVLVIRRHDERTRKLSSYLFPEAKGKIVNVGERMEGRRS